MIDFYSVIGNVLNQFHSTLKDTNLLFLLPALYVTKYECKEILQPCLDDLKKFEATDILVKLKNSNHLFKGSISMIIADNLPAHALRGFLCGFNKVSRFCRFCNCSKQRQRNDPPAEMQLRTLEAYNNNIYIVDSDNSFASVMVLKKGLV